MEERRDARTYLQLMYEQNGDSLNTDEFQASGFFLPSGQPSPVMVASGHLEPTADLPDPE